MYFDFVTVVSDTFVTPGSYHVDNCHLKFEGYSAIVNLYCAYTL